jgi:hypothetical protein
MQPPSKWKKGQATVELLLILSVLFIILALSVNIFGNEQRVAVEKQRESQLTQNAYRIADMITLVGNAPIGTRMNLFLPPGSTDQTFWVRNGVVEGRGEQSLVIVPLSSSEWGAGPLYDGNSYHVERDTNAVSVTLA